MDNLSLIAAIGKNSELGLDNHLLWHISEDLAFYKKMTWGKNIIMGKRTMDSMPLKAFEGRNAFVLSDIPLDTMLDVNSFDNINTLLNYVKNSKEEFIVVGGASIYKQFLPYVKTMYLTEIDEYFNADTFFPDFNVDDYDVTLMGEYEDGNLKYVRNKYVRKKEL